MRNNATYLSKYLEQRISTSEDTIAILSWCCSAVLNCIQLYFISIFLWAPYGKLLQPSKAQSERNTLKFRPNAVNCPVLE